MRLPEGSRLLDVVGEVQGRAKGVDPARCAPQRDGEAQGEEPRPLYGDEGFEVLLEDRGGGVRHDPREPSDDVIGRAFHRQERGEGDEEEEERKEREEEVIGELGRLVGGRMVGPVLVELPGEPPEA